VQEHAADDQQDERDIKPADIAHRDRARIFGLPAVDVHMHLGGGEFGGDALVALPAGGVEIGGLMVERGSLEGRMLCTPWQLEQLAATTEPPCEARPW